MSLSNDSRLTGNDHYFLHLNADVVLGYIQTLKSEISTLKGEEPPVAEQENADDVPTATGDEPPFPPLYESGEDYDKAGDAKQAAADLKASGDWDKALEKYTEAVLAAPPSALLYANRANALLKLSRYFFSFSHRSTINSFETCLSSIFLTLIHLSFADRPLAAERDCDEALKANPDSAKALRMRGKARKDTGKYELALKDLSAAQAIDFDEETVDDLKFLTEKRKEAESAEAEKRNQEEEKLRKRAEEIKKAREEANQARSNSASSSSTPNMPGGFPGNMPGMPNMADIMNDPEILQAMQNPKVMAALQELMAGPGGPMGLMSNPQKLQELMTDPEVGPVLQKLMAKFAGGAAGMNPPPGNADGVPDVEDIPDLDMGDLPELD